MQNKVVTRFAPSPTGFMHVGGVRTALYAWLWAKKNKGTFILRIEDTDKAREVEGSVEHIIESLRWLGIEWDEGPDKGGPNAPYIQSQRLEIYKKYAQILIGKGFAYPDPYSPEEVDEFRKKAEAEKKPFLFREHRPKNEEVWDGQKPLRFKVPEIKSFYWYDVVFGDLSAGPEALDDFILIKGDGYPTYNFGHIVDDIEMGVTHVMRGSEFISSTPKFLSVYEALGIKPPIFATLPPILAEGGKKKLGKRDGAQDILEYRNEGYLPDALVNFLALLGWHREDDKEILTREDLIESFDIERVQKSGAQFDEDKLNWLNKEHIKKLDEEERISAILKYLPEELKNRDIAMLVSERIHKWGDIKDIIENKELEFFMRVPSIDKNKLAFKNVPLSKILENIRQAILALGKIKESDFNSENVKNSLMELSLGMESRGELLHPVRFALSGLDKSPDPFIIAQILGKDETISRLKKVL